MTLASEHDAGEVVLHRHGDVRKRLVVAKANVEGRPVPLDQVLLEVQGFDLAPGDDHLDVADAPRQLGDRVPDVGRGLEVTTHPRPQRLGLAHVEDLAALVAEDVDAGLRRQTFQLVFEPLLHWQQA